MPAMWSKERADAETKRLDIEAKLVAARLGATHVRVIAFYKDGDMVHVLEGGSMPLPSKELYTRLADMLQTLEDRNDDDVKLQ